MNTRERISRKYLARARTFEDLAVTLAQDKVPPCFIKICHIIAAEKVALSLRVLNFHFQRRFARRRQ